MVHAGDERQRGKDIGRDERNDLGREGEEERKEAEREGHGC